MTKILVFRLPDENPEIQKLNKKICCYLDLVQIIIAKLCWKTPIYKSFLTKVFS